MNVAAWCNPPSPLAEASKGVAELEVVPGASAVNAAPDAHAHETAGDLSAKVDAAEAPTLSPGDREQMAQALAVAAASFRDPAAHGPTFEYGCEADEFTFRDAFRVEIGGEKCSCGNGGRGQLCPACNVVGRHYSIADPPKTALAAISRQPIDLLLGIRSGFSNTGLDWRLADWDYLSVLHLVLMCKCIPLRSTSTSSCACRVTAPHPTAPSTSHLD